MLAGSFRGLGYGAARYSRPAKKRSGPPEQAVQIAELIRLAGSYRWVGLYAVTEQEITVIGWRDLGRLRTHASGDPRGQRGGVATKCALVVNDVTADPCYLTAFASTLSEAIVPVIDPDMGTVVGTLDVESAERDAFTDAETRRRSGAPPRSPA